MSPGPPPEAIAAVSFSAGRRRPEDATTVRLGSWEGPLGLLLALVEARRLDVTTVSLGALAEAYLEALAEAADDRLANLSAFVAVASQLILLKSRALLPQPPAPPAPIDDEPDPEAELRARLVVYRAFRDAAAAIQAAALAGRQLVRREPGVARSAALSAAVAPVLERLEPAILAEALARLAAVSPPPPAVPEAIPRTIRLEDRARAIRAAIAGAGPVVLQDLLRGVRDRVVVAVTFLAMLELVKRREVTVEQAAPWGPIIVTPVGRASGPPAADGEVGG